LQEVAKEAIGEAEKSLKNLQQVNKETAAACCHSSCPANGSSISSSTQPTTLATSGQLLL
jgi:hypothetical protein